MNNQGPKASNRRFLHGFRSLLEAVIEGACEADGEIAFLVMAAAFLILGLIYIPGVLYELIGRGWRACRYWRVRARRGTVLVRR
ncbi:hypothetical protein ATY78_13260 [Rhizobium sp. R635]|uniref:hypothetical protein n=1 Tax=Rhizobium sp. R635 TaxID=1764275 RepID=UPI000B53476D|nr:hypothetical protein [Rhizobium sp. R635]OWV78152.1 hypothetical protein ATY78_13260 [Rhizobium sp. R635]